MTENFKEFEKVDSEPLIGKRMLAAFIDYTLIWGFFFFIVTYFGEPVDESHNEYTLNGFPVLFPILFWFFMTVFAENYLGATIGNKIAGLKPVSINNIDDKPSMSQSFKRHLLDPIDMFMFGLIAIIIIKNTIHHQRLGDLWAKTIVIVQNTKTNKNIRF